MNIFIVCAPQTFGCNTGMFSVDLAAWYFFKKFYPQAIVRFFTLYPPKCLIKNSPFFYESSESFLRDLPQADAILYWGDFLHAYKYRNAVVSWLARNNHSIKSALELTRKFLYLKDQDTEQLKKVIVYGGTILFNKWANYEDKTYLADLKRLLSHAKAVSMREVFSARALNYLSSQNLVEYAGDCAFFLSTEVLQNYVAQKLESRKLGFFFGRSHLQVTDVSYSLVYLADSLDLDLEWIHWGEEPFFFKKYSDYMTSLNLKSEPVESNAYSALSSLRNYQLIVTDTYHICVNAWNLGIPAICIIDDLGETVEVNSGQQAPDKRIVFYWSYQLTDFLISASQLLNNHLLNNLACSIRDKESLKLIFDFLGKSKQSYANKLKNSLDDLLVGQQL